VRIEANEISKGIRLNAKKYPSNVSVNEKDYKISRENNIQKIQMRIDAIKNNKDIKAKYPNKI
jgi:hypothetical protein